MFDIIKYSEVDSTNKEAKKHPLFAVILADGQTGGKGRFNRHWSSSSGGIYMSIVFPRIDKPQFYTFAACLSAIKSVDLSGLKIKWPNDLIFGKKKLCGIFTENVGDRSIVGIGINVNNKIPSSLKGKATSLMEIRGKKIDKEKIVFKLMEHFERYYSVLKAGKYSKILSDWKDNSFLGSKVKVKTLKGSFSGVAHDIDEDGFLIVKCNGKKILVREGDVSLT